MGKSTQPLTLKYFDLSTLPRDATIMVYGKRGSGKSIFVKDMMYHLQDIPRGIVISASEKHRPFYSDFIPDTFIFYEYDPEILAKIALRQQEQVKADGGPTPKNNTFIVMDDVLSDVQTWKRDKTLRSFFLEGRHMSIFYCIVMQYSLALPPDLRSNFDYIFIFRDNSLDNRDKLYKNFGGPIGDRKMFDAMMDQGTSDNHCIVINNKSLSNKIEDCFFVYKAKLHPEKFRVGCSSYWKAHDENYKPREEEEAERLEEERRLAQEGSRSVKIVIRSRGGK